jgi:hypothetical protein
MAGQPERHTEDGRITHIVKVVIQELLQDPFWLIVVIAFPALIDWSLYILFGGEAGGLFIIPWLLPIFFYAVVSDRVRTRFWKDVATSKGWQYTGTVSALIAEEEALFLNQGHDRVMQNEIVGRYNELPARVFESKYETGEGKNRQIHKLTAYAFKFTGTFPHCYLNRRDDGHNYAPAGASKIPLPQAFEEVFQLYVPQKYEIEALEIFTPDVLQHLLDTNWPHDIEFVDGELIVFRKGWLLELSTFESEFDQAAQLATSFAKDLDTAQFTKIGSLPYLLKDVAQGSLTNLFGLQPLESRQEGYVLIAVLTAMLMLFQFQFFGDMTMLYLTFAIGCLFAILFGLRSN